MTFIQTIGSRSKRISNQKTLCGWSLRKYDRQGIEILVMLNQIIKSNGRSDWSLLGWILIIMVKSTNNMQVYMYFTRSDLFKTLCLTLICNIKKDFALRNHVTCIFIHFKYREGKVHVLVNTMVLSEKIYSTNISVKGKIKNKLNKWIYLVIFYRAWRRLGGF